MTPDHMQPTFRTRLQPMERGDRVSAMVKPGPRTPLRIMVAALGACFIGTLPALVIAQPVVPIGGEFQLNTYTTGAQANASVSFSEDGGFVAVWESEGSSGSDDSGSSIQGRLFGPDGSPISADFQVNTVTAGSQTSPAVAMNSKGEFFVAWAYPRDDFSTIQGQGFDSNGNPIGNELQIDSGAPYYWANEPSVASGPDGGFVVVWRSYESDLDSNFVRAQLIDADFQPVGDGFSVSSGVHPAVAVGGSGDFLVVWRVASCDCWPPPLGLRGQSYASDGSPLGEEFFISPHGRLPAVDFGSDDRFVVVWESWDSIGTDVDGSSVQGALFSSTGEPIGSAFQVNSLTTGNQGSPSVAVDHDNGFVVAWQGDSSYGTDTDSTSVQGRRFGPGGDPEGPEFQVNTSTGGPQVAPVIASQGAGRLLVVWSSEDSAGDDNSSTSIQGQRFSVAGLSVIEVPTLSSVSLAVLMLALLVSGVRRLRLG